MRRLACACVVSIQQNQVFSTRSIILMYYNKLITSFSTKNRHRMIINFRSIFPGFTMVYKDVENAFSQSTPSSLQTVHPTSANFKVRDILQIYLFVCIDALPPSQQFYSHIGRFPVFWSWTRTIYLSIYLSISLYGIHPHMSITCRVPRNMH